MKIKYIIIKFIWVLVTVLLTFCLIQSMGHFLDPFEAEDGLDAIKAFHELENDSIDAIIYGSSRAWKGCDTRVMRDQYGINAYNYACNWQAINTTYLFVQDSFRTQTPKVIFVETGNVGSVLENTDLNGEIYYTRQIPDFRGKREYIKQCFGGNIERYASYYMPLIMFHDNWTEVDFENFYAPGQERYIRNYGYSEDSNSEVEPIDIPDISKIVQHKLPTKSVEVLDAIVEECNKKGTKLVFYTCPCEKGYNYGEAMKEYADLKEVTYINLYECLEEVGLDGKMDYQDNVHLNGSGAKKVARFLAEHIN